MKEFKGKVAVITGSSNGIGRAVAERLAQEGMKVVLTGVDRKALAKAESEMKAAGHTVLAVRTDVSKIEDMEALARKTLETFSAVHLLHNNAGVSTEGYSILETPLNDWKWVINVNLWGVIHGVMTFSPIMLKQDTECHIINTSSMAGLVSNPFAGSYNVSKFGIVTLSETLYHELQLKRSRVGVSVLCPGLVNTRLADAQRNRPFELRNDPAEEERLKKLPHVEKLRKLSNELFKTAMSPQQVADVVFNAVKEGKFYIITHPEWLAAVQTRTQEIIQQRQPTSMMATLLFKGEEGL